jgi:hypothetical protein
MRVRFFSLLLALLSIPTLAFADFHKVDFSGGGSGGTGGSGVGGFAQSLSWGVKFDNKFIRWTCSSCGIVLPDISVQFGGHHDPVTDQKTDLDTTQVAYQAGFRWTPESLRGRNGKYVDKPTKLFIQLLAGQVYTNDGTAAPGRNGVITLGGGIQYFPRKEDRTTKAGKVEPHCAGLGFQAEFDKIWRSDREGFWRLSVGVVYRFLHPNER